MTNSPRISTAALVKFAERLGDVLRPKFERLEQRIAALESRKSLNYRGVFRDGVEHQAGDIVTFDGSMWHCNAATTDRSGGTSNSWTMCVKRGRDAR